MLAPTGPSYLSVRTEKCHCYVLSRPESSGALRWGRPKKPALPGLHCCIDPIGRCSADVHWTSNSGRPAADAPQFDGTHLRGPGGEVARLNEEGFLSPVGPIPAKIAKNPHGARAGCRKEGTAPSRCDEGASPPVQGTEISGTIG
jgi:hypothetical protein